ncbi:MAG: GDP-L-fucose synthase [Pseudohongiellaceae bacterium]|jgi:GDP-L-fucose synthase
MKLIARELVEITRGIMGLEGRLKFDRTKPDGAPHKLIDISRLEVLESLDVCFT